MLYELDANPAAGPAQEKVTRASAPENRGYFLVKRLLDIAVVVATLPVVIPLVGILALVVRMDGGPAFFAQARVGLGGKDFRMWKLRSMVPDADARLVQYLSESEGARNEWEKTQKLKADPRITLVGRVLRKYSIDELPQLWNVLAGDMSLVGPRPMFSQQRQLYPGTAYFSLRPGLTGLWQISARNNSTFADRAIYDDRYAETVSLMTDLRILLKTAAVVVAGTGL